VLDIKAHCSGVSDSEAIRSRIRLLRYFFVQVLIKGFATKEVRFDARQVK
jgi:hypothetical protein